jgi:hypothetical protein
MTDTAKLRAIYQTRLLNGMALVQVAALLVTVAYFVEGSIACLAVALIAIALLVMRFPTRSGMERWVDKQMTWIEQERGVM